MLSTIILTAIFLGVIVVFGVQLIDFKGGKNTRKVHRKVSDATIIDQAIRHNGQLSATTLAYGCNLPVNTAQLRLNELQEQGVFSVDVDQSGVMVYSLLDKSLLNSKMLKR